MCSYIIIIINMIHMSKMEHIILFETNVHKYIRPPTRSFNKRFSEYVLLNDKKFKGFFYAAKHMV